MDEPQPPPLPPVELAGAARDAELRLAAALSREEVLRRRRRRLLQLCSLYRAQFWALADKLPARHGEYWWEHGASPVLPDEPPPHSLALLKANGARAGSPGNGGLVGPQGNGCRGAVAPPAAAAAGRAACAASNCEAKAMPLSQYCFNHILLDPKQQLYQPCAFPTRKSGTSNGEAICGNPVLRGITPLRCADHDPKSQKLVVEALRNAGIDMPLTKMEMFHCKYQVPRCTKSSKQEMVKLLDVMLECSEGCCSKLTCWLLLSYPPLIHGRKKTKSGLGFNSHRKNAK